ncbi:hypothetical protein BV898_18399 [Hypsibius exemplaris]|uniref:RIIa domain-containing protein n=1 Tax=Hypsibius exemplaris TaxID=2072580 RepID=A0A9X6RNS5_HYPEX|nr:hypothetical protein BV898_18399 [Hypsibius exemplaris]
MDHLEEDDQTFALKGPAFWQKETLSDRQKGELAQMMFAENEDDERYLRVHPEVDYIMAAIVMAALESPPKDALRFAIDYLSQDNLKEQVMSQVSEYRMDDIARRRLHELEYRGTVPLDAESDLAAVAAKPNNTPKRTDKQ